MLTIPLHAAETFNSDRPEDEPVLLMEVEDDASLGGDPSDHIRLCSFPVQRLSNVPATYGCMSRGYQYLYAVTGAIPSDQNGQPLQGTLGIDNVDQALTALFLNLTSQNVLTLTLVLASDPDTPIRSFPKLGITNCMLTEDTITITFNRYKTIYGGDTNPEPWPSGLQTIDNAPGLFK